MTNSSVNNSPTNRNRVFRKILSSGQISKQMISESLKLSAPTIRQCLRELYGMNIICKNGYYESTGGRKAEILTVNANARIAIGVELIRESVRITAVNLRGEIVKEAFILLPFDGSETYYVKFGELVNQFAESLNIPRDDILEVMLAVQGLVSHDGSIVISGQVLGYTGTKRETFQKYIHYPCRLVHDTEAAAFAESWNNAAINNAVLLMLNRNLGGALIINGQVFHGTEYNGCIIEHMRLVPNGAKCYCGRKGCFEAYCSVNSLEAKAGMSTKEFFEKLQNNDHHCEIIFDNYLSNLALGINNIRMLIDCNFIIGGLLDSYLTDQHIELLAEKVRKESSFQSTSFCFQRSLHGSKAASRGAALLEIDSFINSI